MPGRELQDIFKASAHGALVYHGTNLVYVFGNANNTEYDVFAQAYQDIYINFINSRNPGRRQSLLKSQKLRLIKLTRSRNLDKVHAVVETAATNTEISYWHDR